MVFLHNKQPGDVFYPDYDRRVSIECAVPVVKGRLYTVGSNGKVYSFGDTASDVTIAGRSVPVGVYPGVSSADFDRLAHARENCVQATNDAAAGEVIPFMLAGSRIGLVAGEDDDGLVPGDLVGYSVSTDNNFNLNRAYKLEATAGSLTSAIRAKITALSGTGEQNWAGARDDVEDIFGAIVDDIDALDRLFFYPVGRVFEPYYNRDFEPRKAVAGQGETVVVEFGMI